MGAVACFWTERDKSQIAFWRSVESKRRLVYRKPANSGSDGYIRSAWWGRRSVRAALYVPWISLRRSDRVPGDAKPRRARGSGLLYERALHHNVPHSKRHGKPTLEKYCVGSTREFSQRADRLPAARRTPGMDGRCGSVLAHGQL